MARSIGYYLSVMARKGTLEEGFYEEWFCECVGSAGWNSLDQLKCDNCGCIRPDAPCNFDHNGECLFCDCWPSNCPFIVRVKS